MVLFSVHPQRYFLSSYSSVAVINTATNTAQGEKCFGPQFQGTVSPSWQPKRGERILGQTARLQLQEEAEGEGWMLLLSWLSPLYVVQDRSLGNDPSTVDSSCLYEPNQNISSQACLDSQSLVDD